MAACLAWETSEVAWRAWELTGDGTLARLGVGLTHGLRLVGAHSTRAWMACLRNSRTGWLRMAGNLVYGMGVAVMEVGEESCARLGDHACMLHRKRSHAREEDSRGCRWRGERRLSAQERRGPSRSRPLLGRPTCWVEKGPKLLMGPKKVRIGPEFGPHFGLNKNNKKKHKMINKNNNSIKRTNKIKIRQYKYATL